MEQISDEKQKNDKQYEPQTIYSHTQGSDSYAQVEILVNDSGLLAKSYGEPGIHAFLKSTTVLLCSWAAAMCGFLYGYDQGLINVTLSIPRFLEAFPMVDTTADSHAGFYKGLVTAIFELGAVIGALQAAIFSDKISRRYTIIIAVAWYLVGSVLQAVARDYTMLVFGCLVGGIGVGAASMIAPLYINEIAPPHIRGALYTLQQWMLILGIVAAFYTTYGARYIAGDWSWRTAFVAQILPAFVLLSVVYVLPFSPRWLGLVGRDTECLATLAKLRKLPTEDTRVQAEWIIIRAEAILQARLSGVSSRGGSKSFRQHVICEYRRWARCAEKRYIKRIWLGVVINLFQQWVGVNGFTYYSTTLFAQLGYGYEQRLTLSGLLCVCQLVGSTVPIFIIDRVGRRPLLLVGTFFLISCHVINATVVGAGTAFMFVFMFFFEISWGPIAWGLPAEILPSAVRAEGAALSTASNWLNNFVVGLIVPAIVQQAPYASFALFACTAFCATIWVFLFVPETKGKTIEELSGTFGDGASEEETAMYSVILSQVLGAGVAMDLHLGEP
ncbi:MFS monosaccharide transporter [Lecanosticta acicola]|uniref:MFS monosaccharide transporter n=1 Tax=Lecanosticta acicola TaxID=111012 RepID=A0AAI8YYP5_9PEZI|nr:MFS monosaccharide transporter [Lecanosticta acicola]